MANISILDAFERMWQHVLVAVGKKADTTHSHDDVYYTESEIDRKLLEVNTSIQNIDYPVDSVNGKTGAVVLTASDVGALPNTTVIPSIEGLATETYADNAAAAVKNDLLNGAGDAYDTLKELGDLINENVDAIEALETVASNKADADHNHDDRYYTETEIDAKLLEVNNSLSTYIKTVNGEAPDENGNVQISVGTAQLQADWNQNDETAQDYVKNRTHYEGTRALVDDSFNDGLGSVFYNSSFETNPLVIGQKYLYKLWNSEIVNEPAEFAEAICVVDENGEPQITLRDARFNFEYIIQYNEQYQKLYLKYSNGGYSWEDLRVIICINEIVKIDPKYLPDEVVTKQYFENNIPVGIKAITIEEVGTVLISFTIDGWGTYQAKEGMTWAEWIESEYNTIGAKADGTDVIFPDDPEWNSTWYVLDEDGNSVTPDDVIAADYTYLAE